MLLLALLISVFVNGCIGAKFYLWNKSIKNRSFISMGTTLFDVYCASVISLPFAIQYCYFCWFWYLRCVSSRAFWFLRYCCQLIPTTSMIWVGSRYKRLTILVMISSMLCNVMKRGNDIKKRRKIEISKTWRGKHRWPPVTGHLT